MKYKLEWYENGQKNAKVTSHFHELFALKRKLKSMGVMAIFMRCS